MTHNAKYRAFLMRNANSALQKMNSSNQFGHRWDCQWDIADFVRQTAGVDLLLLNAALAAQSIALDLSYLNPLLLSD